MTISTGPKAVDYELPSQAGLACRVSLEPLDTVGAHGPGSGTNLDWNCPFVLPAWLATWWHVFGPQGPPGWYVIRNGPDILGLAPLIVEDGLARFIGSPDVCDYFDMIVEPDHGSLFFKALTDHLRQQGVTSLNLSPLREGSMVLKQWPALAGQHGYTFSCKPEAVTMEMDLPASWETWLQGLHGKERHEVRRKLRRLEEAGQVRLRVLSDPAGLKQGMATFLKLFNANRRDKAAFMSDLMEAYFTILVSAMSRGNWVTLFLLELNDQAVAATLCFDYRSVRYLYNNGYDDRYAHLSVGLISKILTIRDGIERGLKRYSFLKGAERYKQRLGGKPVALWSGTLDLVPPNGSPGRHTCF